MAEAVDSKPIQCQFKSDDGYFKGGNMPVIDTATSEEAADRLVEYWCGKLLSMGAESVAGIGKVCMSPRRDEWDIVLEIYVDEGSEAYKDFMRRWR